jgi:hypothetical protein
MQKHFIIFIISFSMSLGIQEIDLSMEREKDRVVLSLPAASGFKIIKFKNSQDNNQFSIQFQGLEIASVDIPDNEHMQTLMRFIISNYSELKSCTKQKSMILDFMSQIIS